MQTNQINELNCFHCGDYCKTKSILLDNKYFCCNGCKSVYQILNENDLCSYYDLNEHAGLQQANEIRDDKFAYLENEEVEQKLIQFKDSQQTHVTFFLPQIHCSSCLYLLENIHKINKDIITSKINFSKKEIFIIFNNTKISLKNIVETLTKIGYEPHLSLHSTIVNPNSIPSSKLYKVGIAGFCFANIMMLSLPEYFSLNSYIESNLSTIFKYMCLFLSLPVIFYSATEFYSSAWNGIKNKYLNIDIPVVLAVLITFLRSLYEIFTTNGNGYFDSMSGIVFFMLIGRIAQDKTNQYLSFERDYTSFFPIAVNKLFGNLFKPIPIQQLNEGDIIQIFSNEIIPVDAILSKGNAEIDYSFVNGESIPVVKSIGEIIYAGGKNLNEKIELLVVKPMDQSYLTNLWNKSNYLDTSSENKFVNTLSKYFTILILLIGFSAFFYWTYNNKLSIGFNALTTVLIVACPCTLLLSSTFTYGNMLRVLAKNKFYIRHPSVLELFNSVDTIVYDKTGTLTHGNQINVSYSGTSPIDSVKQYIISLAMQSNHPYSKAIVNFWDNIDVVKVANFKEITGKGLEAWIDDHYIKMGSADFFNINTQHHQSIVIVAVDNSIIGQFVFSNVYRDGFINIFHSLKSNFKQFILSGDTESEKSFLQKSLGIDIKMFFNQKPTDKLSFIQDIQHQQKTVMMIGDGLNDAGALKQSDVGIAITENSNNFSPACDGILDASQFYRLPLFLKFAHLGKYVIVLSFIFSIIYNIVGLSFALHGNLSPLIAAILMPLSSISIIILTFSMSQFFAWKLGLLKT